MTVSRFGEMPESDKMFVASSSPGGLDYNVVVFRVRLLVHRQSWSAECGTSD